MSRPLSPIATPGLAPRFWERRSLAQMSQAEWEALCDGCGKCCMNKLEDEETGEVAFTRVACRLFDDSSCRCANYPIRHQFVPDCIRLTPETIEDHAYWLPQTCAYKLLAEGRSLPPWHPLITGTAHSVHHAGVSMQDRTIGEHEILLEEWEDQVIEEPL